MNRRTRRIGAALALTVIVVLLRANFSMPSDGFLFLLIAPIAIIAVEFAFVGGLVAALIGAAIVVGFDLSGVMDYSNVGVTVRVAAFLIAGAGVGYLVQDRNRREAQIAALERRAQEHREGIRLNDEIVQGLAVAKMALEMGEAERAKTTIDTTLKRAQQIASKHLDHEGPLARGEASGEPAPQ